MKFPWLHEFTDGRGKRRRYVRDAVAGKRIAINAPPSAPEFVEEYLRALTALGLPLREWPRKWRRNMHVEGATAEWERQHIVRAWRKAAKPKNAEPKMISKPKSSNPWDDAPTWTPARKGRPRSQVYLNAKRAGLSDAQILRAKGAASRAKRLSKSSEPVATFVLPTHPESGNTQ